MMLTTMLTMKHRFIAAACALALVGLAPHARAQTSYTENFTGTATSNSWYFLNGACLTMGTSATSTAADPACTGLAYYTNKGDTNLKGGNTGTLPDTVSGALRFTNSYNENGAILSNFNFPLASAGLAVSFTTVTYEGNSGGSGADGADGISFFLQDATYAPDVGAFGGSLGYTCSNSNNDTTLRSTGIPRGYDGLQGGYVGLGIDEYGNFLNQSDNTATGYGYVPGRIGMRGRGSITWAALNAAYPIQYPSSLPNSQKAAAVQYACSHGTFQDYSVNAYSPIAFTPSSPLPDYAAIAGAYKVLPTTQKIANESATLRSQALPITYNLKITTSGLLSLSYSYNGGALQNVITNQDITSGGTVPLPTNIRFGFAGSTGGSTNIHEVMCFQATPAATSESSVGINQRQSAKVQQGTQVYFAYYNPVTLAGSLTSQYVDQSATNANLLTIDPVVNWDGSCVLTGVPASTSCDGTGTAGPTSAESPASRQILSYDGTKGIPFEWANLPTAMQANLDNGDATVTNTRLNYLRGDRSLEQTPTSATTFSGIYRTRTSVLGDIIDSSPTWVGPPSTPYPNVWADNIHTTGDTFPENTGQTYSSFASAGTAANNQEMTRTNVVYAGANDGMLHGFRSGNSDSTGAYVKTNNDGEEVLAYVPGYIVNNIQNSYNVARNYSDPQYGHRFDVDAAPGTGDLFYNNKWHTWLVSGLGPGGPAIFALDVTDPDSMFSEGNAPNIVIGEWTSAYTVSITNPTTGTTTTTSYASNLNCANVSACGQNYLGNTYGTPQIRRFHNGSWGAVFGNGFGSSKGDAGIFVMLVSNSGTISFYYLSTNTMPGNGIAFTSPTDLDSDHIVDYVYAGDLLGNVWRFDLTDTNPANWAVTPGPVYTTPTGQPISTKIIPVIVPNGAASRMILEFGTGREIPQTNSAAAQYATSQQAIYGVWDWNMASWNTLSTAQFNSLPITGIAKPTSPLSGTAKLQQQTIVTTQTATQSGTGSDYRTISNNAICWADTVGCTQYGFYLNLVYGNAYSPDPATPQNGNSTYAANPVVYEQVVFNPVFNSGVLSINTIIPAATAATMCFSSAQSGWTMALDATTGGRLTVPYFDSPTTDLSVTDSNGLGISGEAKGATGSVSYLVSGSQYYQASQNSTGHGDLSPVTLPSGYRGNRVTWIQRR